MSDASGPMEDDVIEYDEYPPDVVTQRDRDNYDMAEEMTWD